MSAPSPKMSPAGCEHMNHGACNPALAIVISVHVRPGLAEVIAKLPPLGLVDVQRAEVICGHPRALNRLIVRGRRAADRAARTCWVIGEAAATGSGGCPAGRGHPPPPTRPHSLHRSRSVLR